MTRKDYIVLAQALATAGIEIEGPQQAELFERIVDQIADALALDNPRFDRARFNAAAIGG